MGASLCICNGDNSLLYKAEIENHNDSSSRSSGTSSLATGGEVCCQQWSAEQGGGLEKKKKRKAVGGTMSGTKAETQQCRVPVFDPDTLASERGSGQARERARWERGTAGIMKSRKNIHVHVMAAARVSTSSCQPSLLFRATLPGVTMLSIFLFF